MVRNLKLGPALKNEERRRREESARVSKDLAAKVIIYPGTKLGYEQRAGYEIEEIPLNRQNQGVTMRQFDGKEYQFQEDFETLSNLVNQGIEAIVDVKFSMIRTQENGYYVGFFYGIPVRRKQ